MQLSEHFTLEEMTYSATGVSHHILNVPGSKELHNLEILCRKVLEPARLKYGKPMHVTSGYRNKAINILVGGNPRSYHLQGKAADIQVSDLLEGEKLCRIFSCIRSVDLALNEYTDYSNWVHVQFSDNPRHKIYYKYKV